MKCNFRPKIRFRTLVLAIVVIAAVIWVIQMRERANHFEIQVALCGLIISAHDPECRLRNRSEPIPASHESWRDSPEVIRLERLKKLYEYAASLRWLFESGELPDVDSFLRGD
jgi:hypothetical protein